MSTLKKILAGLLLCTQSIACGPAMEPAEEEALKEPSIEVAKSPLSTPNVLANPDFKIVGPSGSSTSVITSVPGGAGNSAAASWTLFTNTPGTIKTQQVASTFPGTPRMIHVDSPGHGDGLVQVFLPYNTGPAKVNVEAYVYLYSGKVGIGAGNGGNTNISASTAVLGSWQLLKGPNLNSPANEFIVYSIGGAASFDVAFAAAYETP